MSDSSSTPFPLGVFVGNANIDDPVAEAVFDAENENFDSLMGARPAFMNTYIDFTQSPSAWLNNTSWSADSAAASPSWSGEIPVIALPMGSTSADAPSTEQILENYADGSYDSMLQGMVKAWANDGFMTQYWRPGVEMNLVGSPGFVGSDASLQALWITAFQHIYTTLHAAAAADGVTMKVIWNPGLVNGTPAGNATQTMWPGKDYVDVIGGDIYGEVTPYSLYDWAANGQQYGGSIYDSSVAQFASNPINLDHYYSYPAATATSSDGSGGDSLSLLQLISFAEAQGLPIAIPETGAGGDGAEINAGLSDNPYFPEWLASTLKTATVPITVVSIWDDNGGGSYAFTGGAKPLEAAAWAKYFGAQATTTTTTGTSTGSVHSASPADTTVKGTAGTIYDKSGNAWTITSGRQIAENGTIVPSSANVTTLFWTGTALDQLNTSGDWWTQPLDGSAGTELSAAPAGYATAATPITITPATESMSTDPVSVKPFAGIVITDANAGQTETATVSLSATGNGTLSDPNSSTDHSTIANGVLTVSGSATAVAAALDGLLFTPSSSSAPAVTTTVTAEIKDTAGETASATSTIKATHDASPADTTVKGTAGTIYDTSGNAWTITSGEQIAENGTVVPSSAEVTTLFWTGTALDQLNTSGDWWTQPLNGSAGTELSAAPAGYATAATPITITPTTKAVATTDAASAKPFTGVVITDPNARQTETATVSLSAAANGMLSDPNASTDHSTITNGVLTVSGSATAVSTALDGLVFTPTANQVAAGAAVTTTVTAVIKDTAGETASAASTITATQVAASPPATDTIVLDMSEDYAGGNAEFTVSVNGKQVGGVYQANALHSSGDAGTVSLTGDWNSGVNDVAVSFINHAYGRNLYVNSISENGVTYAGTSAAFPLNGTDTFAVGGTTATESGAADTLDLKLSEDAWNGNAEFVLYIDGKEVTTPQVVSALHDANQTQTFGFTGNLGAGSHTVGIGFINDAYGGSSSEDRNLYIDGITLNGSSVFSGVKEEDLDGTSVFTVATTH
jgi:hypothetical protein